MGRGVSCHQCGAGTPLPDDLRTPTFACAFCRATLETASYAGVSAVSADALLGHIRGAMAGAPPAAPAPRFEGGNTASRAAECQNCRAPVAVPLALEIRELTCTACGRTQPISQYVSDQERFALDMARQMSGNDALRRVQAEGVPCPQCGGKNRVPDDGSVQFPCSFCKATILLSDHVDASAVARSRLKHGVFALRDDAIRAQKDRDRLILKIVLGGLLGLAVVGGIVGLLASR